MTFPFPSPLPWFDSLDAGDSLSVEDYELLDQFNPLSVDDYQPFDQFAPPHDQWGPLPSYPPFDPLSVENNLPYDECEPLRSYPPLVPLSVEEYPPLGAGNPLLAQAPVEGTSILEEYYPWIIGCGGEFVASASPPLSDQPMGQCEPLPSYPPFVPLSVEDYPPSDAGNPLLAQPPVEGTSILEEYYPLIVGCEGESASPPLSVQDYPPSYDQPFDPLSVEDYPAPCDEDEALVQFAAPPSDDAKSILEEYFPWIIGHESEFVGSASDPPPPIGFKFRPTEEELIVHLLLEMINVSSPLIAHADIYDYEPQHLSGMFFLS